MLKQSLVSLSVCTAVNTDTLINHCICGVFCFIWIIFTLYFTQSQHSYCSCTADLILQHYYHIVLIILIHYITSPSNTICNNLSIYLSIGKGTSVSRMSVWVEDQRWKGAVWSCILVKQWGYSSVRNSRSKMLQCGKWDKVSRLRMTGSG